MVFFPRKATEVRDDASLSSSFFFFAKECFFFIRVLERDFDEEGCVFSVLDMMMMMMLLEMMRVLVRAVL